jgi:transcriptional regulator with XRE-family HTH domain
MRPGCGIHVVLASFHAEMARQSTDALVRDRLRALRVERGLSQEEVAERAGMAPSTLSRLESGARRLALDHLAPLAGALGVEVGDLLAPATGSDPRVRERARTVEGITYRPLSRAGPSGLRVVRMDLPEQRTVPDPRSHEGHEWLYVLAGRVRLVLGDDDLVLAPGEAAEFSTWTPHWIGAVDGPAQVLAIFGPQGERVHMRARR